MSHFLLRAILLAASPETSGFVQGLAALSSAPFHISLLGLGAVFLLIATTKRLPIFLGQSIEAADNWRPVAAILGSILIIISTSIFVASSTSTPNSRLGQSLTAKSLPARLDTLVAATPQSTPRYAWVPVGAVKKVPYQAKEGVVFGKTFHVWFSKVVTINKQRRPHLRICRNEAPADSSDYLFDDFVPLGESQFIPIQVGGIEYRFEAQTIDNKKISFSKKPQSVDILFTKKMLVK